MKIKRPDVGLSADSILDNVRGGMEKVLVIGWNNEGDLDMVSNENSMMILSMLELAKYKVINKLIEV